MKFGLGDCVKIIGGEWDGGQGRVSHIDGTKHSIIFEDWEARCVILDLADNPQCLSLVKKAGNNTRLADGLFITDNGLSAFPRDEVFPADVELCTQWITKFAKPCRTFNIRGSYTLKHDVEEWAGKYVSNGAFIEAAIKLGYNYEPYPPNASFNMSFPKRGSAEYKEAFGDRG